MAMTKLKYQFEFPTEARAKYAYHCLDPLYPDIVFSLAGSKLIYWGTGSFLHGRTIDAEIKRLGGIPA